MKMLKLNLGLLISMPVFTFSVYAGIGYSLKCSDCGLEEELLFDRGFVMKVVANGYCMSCNKFVRITHGTATDEKGRYVNSDGATITEEEIKSLEKPIGYVYSPNSKTKSALYPCPVCGKPFIRIVKEDFGSIENPEKIHCPKCGKKTLEGVPGISWD